MKNKLSNLVFSALFLALTFVATKFLQVPIATGYINLGDCFLLLGVFLLGPVYGTISGVAASVIADLMSGYAVYAPATLIIKTAMAIVAYIIVKLISNKGKKKGYLLASIIAETIMVLGYLSFEYFILDLREAAFPAVPMNSIQGIAAVILSVLLVNIVNKTNIFNIKE